MKAVMTHTVRYVAPRETLSLGGCYSNPYELLVGAGELSDMPMWRATRDFLDLQRAPQSDYEKFAALCAAMPLWVGHPLFDACHGVLFHVLGCTEEMTPEHAPELWNACARRLADEGIGVTEALRRLGVERLRLPVAVGECQAELTLPDVTSVAVEPLLSVDDLPSETWGRRVDSLDALTACLTKAVDTVIAYEQGGVEVVLPEKWRFVRPNPYHATEALKTLNQGRGLADEAKWLLWGQVIRTLGQACVSRGMTLTLRGGESTEVRRILDYLKGCDCCPSMVYIPCVAGDFGDLLGEDGLFLGLSLTGNRTTGELMAAYAAHAPIGCLSHVDVPVASALDAWRLLTI